MKMKRYLAKDSRQALRQIRDELGPDAVILSNRRVPGGVEIITAIEYDESLLAPPVRQPRKAQPIETLDEAPALKPSIANEQAKFEKMLEQFSTEDDAVQINFSEPSLRQIKSITASEPAPQIIVEQPITNTNPEPKQQMVDGLQHELKNLRGLLEYQMSGLVWQDYKTRKPLEAELFKKLLGLGLESAFARQLAAQMITIFPEATHFNELWDEAMDKLAALIPIYEDQAKIRNRAFAVIGAAGVGKTACLANYAANWICNEGHEGLVFISLDFERVAANEVLKAYARILSVPFYVVDSYDSLSETLEALSESKMILIDTPALVGDDNELWDKLSFIKKSIGLSLSMVLSATQQYAVLMHSLEQFKKRKMNMCMLTHCDDAISLGAAITALIQQDAPLAYLSNGQRVPDDFSAAQAQLLMTKALQKQPSQVSQDDDEELACKLAGVGLHE